MIINIGRSKIMLGYLLMSHLTAILIVTAVALPLAVKIMTAGVLSISLLLYCRLFHWLPTGRGVVALLSEQQEGWYLLRADGERCGPLVLKRSVVMSQLLIVYLQSMADSGTCSVVIPVDAVDSDAWRKLRVRLRDPASWEQ